MKYSTNKDIAHLISELVREGWRFQRGGRHGKLRSPSGRYLIVPGSPSDWRAFKNFERDARQMLRDNHHDRNRQSDPRM